MASLKCCQYSRSASWRVFKLGRGDMNCFTMACIISAVVIAIFSACASASAFASSGCASSAPAQHILNISTTSITVPNRPFGIAYLTNETAFVAVGRNIGVLDTSQLTPVLKHLIPLSPYALWKLGLHDDDPDTDNYIIHGLAITHDGQNLYATAGAGVAVLDTEKAAVGDSNPIVGVLANNGLAGNYTAMVSITPDDQYIFLTQEFGSRATLHHGAVEVWNVTRTPSGFVTGVYQGYITLGLATVGMAFSADSSKLYVTNEAGGARGSVTSLTEGTVAILDVGTLKTNPKRSYLWSVSAGCHPVRVRLGTDGAQLWVTAREANELLVFDTAMLDANKTAAGSALLGKFQTGTSPVALALVGNHVITADSNRFGFANTTAGLSVVNTRAIKTGNFKLASPQIPTGLFPREFGLSPDEKTLLVSEYDSYTIRAVNVSLLSLSG